MAETKKLGIDYTLSNGVLTRIDVDDEHYYFHDDVFHIGVTTVIDIGGPFPEGLRNWLRWNDGNETTDHMEGAKNRGSKLHHALEDLIQGLSLKSEDYKTNYEKQAITTFIRWFKFLQPKQFVSEFVVSDPELRVSGTVDFKGVVDARRVQMLLEPLKYLEVDKEGNYQPKPLYAQMLENTEPKWEHVIIDWKFTARNAYSHKVQVAKYAQMNGLSYKEDAPIDRKFSWRFSQKHKFGFDFCESTLSHESFNRIYDTTIEYLGKFPEPPKITVYPDRFQLLEGGKS